MIDFLQAQTERLSAVVTFRDFRELMERHNHNVDELVDMFRGKIEEPREFLEGVMRKAVEITEEIKAGTFNYLKWFPNGNKAHLFKPVDTEPSDSSATLRQFYTQWIADKIPPLVKKSRGRKYRSHFQVHILPFHGDVQINLYSFSHIRDLRIHLVEEKKLKVKTAKNIIGATLRALFRDARVEGKINKNPFDDLPKKMVAKNHFTRTRPVYRRRARPDHCLFL